MNTADTPTPAWIWMIVLSPFLVLLCLPAIIYVKGYAQARAVSDSLVPIGATVLSVKETVCGGHTRHRCYRVVMEGALDGLPHKYQTSYLPQERAQYAEGANGNLFAIEGQRRHTILVAPHPGNVEISRMYWNRRDPIDEFKASGLMALFFIGFELLVFPLAFWDGVRNKRKQAT
jgi:hypothetical protein